MFFLVVLLVWAAEYVHISRLKNASPDAKNGFSCHCALSKPFNLSVYNSFSIV